jgi:hypothetical protein
VLGYIERRYERTAPRTVDEAYARESTGHGYDVGRHGTADVPGKQGGSVLKLGNGAKEREVYV